MSGNGANSLTRIRAVMVKEFTQLLRDRTTFSMMVMIPIIQLTLFGFAINTDPKHLPTAIYIEDNSVFSRSFLMGLKNSDYFRIDHEITSNREADALLQRGDVQFVVNVPPHFARDFVRGERPALMLEADATDPIATASAIGALNGILQRVLEHDLKGPLAHLKGKPDPVEMRVQRRYNPEGFSRYNIVPGLMGIVLTMTGVMMTALAITRERERGTMENLLAMPVHPIEVMAGKIAPYVIIGYVQAAIIVLAAKLLFGVPVLGSLFLLSAALIVFITCNLALGFTLSASAQNQMQAMQLSFMIMLPSILLSGFMFPFRGMPDWAQVIGSLMPATYFIRIARGILLKGATFSEIWPHFWPMLIFMVVVTLIAMKRYKRTLD
jgi:ABC-2 type transport system permease protein